MVMRTCLLGVAQLLGCSMAFLSCLWLLALFFVLHEMDSSDLELIFFHTCKILMGITVLIASCLLSMGAYVSCSSFVRLAMVLFAISAVAVWVIHLAEREVINSHTNNMGYIFVYTTFIIVVDLGLLALVNLMDREQDNGLKERDRRLVRVQFEDETLKCRQCGSTQSTTIGKREELYVPS